MRFAAHEREGFADEVGTVSWDFAVAAGAGTCVDYLQAVTV
jgi:hypothetical protein